ncbi:SUMF1/EgtB/PvdO family nonheme iron enzyme [Proteobacteria bacterium 005FR1]|nr:SUMF1/EgtB/PvdO family nonheme iron enzyme [Proteobacteria bacterium 005FR1]
MQIPGYRIIRKINQGGMSTVYLAVQLSVGREVALKVMSPVLNVDPVFSQRFQREANIVGQLSHPNIVSIYDIGRHKGLNYIAMDYLPGGTVHDRMRRGMSSTEVLQVVREIARALDVAHGKGYVHRDIKPENILFREDGTAVLTDFGVAKAARIGAKVTNAGTVVGTPHYMSPEQSRGLPIDGRADIYSLGVVFYEMLTGVVPFQAEEAVAIAIKHLSAPIPALPPHYALFQPLLDRLMAKEPEQRFQIGGEIVDAVAALEEALSGPSSHRTPLTDPAAMNLSALLKALWLTSMAALRLKANQQIRAVLSWRWTPLRGFHRAEIATTTQVELASVGGQHTTLVSAHASPVAKHRRSSGGLKGGFVVLLAAAFTWFGGSIGFSRFELAIEDQLPSPVYRAMLTTANNLGFVDDIESETIEPATAFSSESPPTGVEAGVEVQDEVGSITTKNVDDLPPTPVASFALTVQAEPADARVRILNIRERYHPGISLKAGAYHVEVSRPGYAGISEWVQLEEGDKELKYSLAELHVPGENFADDLTGGGTGPELVVIAPGRFLMGKQGAAEFSPVREVVIPTKFAVSKHEITFAAYEKFARATGAGLPGDQGWGRGSRPVVNVSWNEAIAFTEWLSAQTGERYRLPTEAEWEYLARAGTTGDYWWGDEQVAGKANCKRGCDSDYTGLFSSSTAPVGSFPANPFDLHDTAGNVAEWVQDCFQNHYVGAPDDASPVLRDECPLRSVRGGAANDSYRSLTSYAREGIAATTRNPLIGFRVVREFSYLSESSR